MLRIAWQRLFAAGLAGAAAITAAPAQALAYRLGPAHYRDRVLHPVAGEVELPLTTAPRFVGYDDGAAWFHAADEPVPRSEPLLEGRAPPSKRFTIELWTAIDYLDQRGGLVSIQGSSDTGARGVHLAVDGGRWRLGVTTDKSGSVILTSGAVVAARIWTHVAITFDGRKLTLFVDGESIITGDARGAVDYGSLPTLRLGGAILAGDQPQGAAVALYHVHVHDRSLNKAALGKLARKRPEQLVTARRVSLRRHSHAPYALDQRQGRIDRAIDRAALWLLEQQNPNGTFTDEVGWVTGRTALATLALVEAGEDPDSDAIRASRDYLRAHTPETTYELGVYLLMLGAIADDRDRALAQAMTDRLLSFESKTLPGTWAYPTAEPDLSNTQFAALGLLGAAQLGIEIPREVFDRMIGTMVGQFRGKPRQSRRGGISGSVTAYSYWPDAEFTSAAMTSAATSIFAVADRVAGLRWEPDSKLGRTRQQALDWIAANYEECLGPYTIYGVERTAALLGLSHFGTHEWYPRAADNIVGYQEPDGSWMRGDLPNSAFNLLVLRRATRRMVHKAPVTGAATLVQQAGDVRFCCRPGPEPTCWLAGFADAPGFDALRVVKLRWLVDGKTVATLDGSADRPWAGEAFPAKVAELAEGRHELQVEVDVVDGEGRAQTLRGQPLVVGG